MKNRSSVSILLSIYYALVFMSGASFFSYIGLYYAAIHLNDVEIGLLTTVGACVALVAQPYWGLVSDRARYKNGVLLLCIGITAGLTWLFPLAGNLLWMLIASMAVFSVFQCAINPLSDTMTLELATTGLFRFSTIRTVGSLGYALMAAIAGWIFTRGIRAIFPTYFVLMVLSFALALRIPQVKGHQGEKNRVSILALFKYPNLVRVYVYAFFIQATMGFFFAFQAVYSKEQGIGTGLVGIGLMIGSFSQFPFMIFFDRLYRRFGLKTLLLWSGIVHAVRWGLYAFALTPTMMLALWVLHGGTYMVFYLCLAEYVNQHVAKELKATGQMMNALVISGLSKILGGVAGGACAAVFSMKATFAGCSVLCLASVIMFFLFSRLSPTVGNETQSTLAAR